MEALARELLEKLLHSHERLDAGVRSRSAALTPHALRRYREMRLHRDKESVEAVFDAARLAGAIALRWDGERQEGAFVQRVEMVDSDKLATFLGRRRHADAVVDARRSLEGFCGQWPVIAEVLERWRLLRKVRTLGAESAPRWLDAIRAIEHARALQTREAQERPLREVSAQLFRDSKRLEALVAIVDVLLCASVEPPQRPPRDVWQELGLYREESPSLLAGALILERNRVTAMLDQPYSGLPSDAVLRVVTQPTEVLSIENLTTFHSEARRRHTEPVLLLYTAGMPSPRWRAMYGRLLASIDLACPIRHWGDVDEGGFRIAATLARDAQQQGHRLQPWKMNPDAVPIAQRRVAPAHVLAQMQRYADEAGWRELGEDLQAAGFTVEQEALSGHDGDGRARHVA